MPMVLLLLVPLREIGIQLNFHVIFHAGIDSSFTL